MSVRKRTWKTGGGERRSAWLVDYIDRDGKRHIETLETKGAAKEREAEIATGKKAGTHVARTTSITIEQAGDNWLDQCTIDELQATTITQYGQHLRLHINPRLGCIKLADLTGPEIVRFERTLAKSGVSEALRRKISTSLGSLLAQALQEGYVNRNVVRDGTRRKTRKIKKKKLVIGIDIPTPEEIANLIKIVDGRFRPFFITAVFTGMRASELRGLSWPEIDFKESVIHVRQRADRYNEIDAPKSEAGTRTIPVGPFVMNTLKEWKIQCPKGDLNLVFPTGTGNVLNYSNIRTQMLIPLMEKAGIVDRSGRAKYTGLHALRHFYASWLVNPKGQGGQGLPPKVVQDRLGHATMAMTMDTYSHLFPREDDLKEIEAAELALLGT